MDKLPQNLKKNFYILILCGGTGPRLWPLSRADNPKPFLHLLTPHSLLQNTIDRSLKLTSSKNIFVISNSRYQSKLKKEISSQIPLQNLLLEPEKKNTTMAILYGCAIISKINPNAIIASFPSDHFITKIQHFQQNIYQCVRYTQTLNTIFCLGIKPLAPNQAFGYINPGKKTNIFHKVDSFTEKPELNIAVKLIKNGSLWNSGIYIFSLKTLEEELAKYQKNYLAIYQKLTIKNLAKLYHLAENLPFDKAISEKTKRLLVLPATFGWSDIGQWQAIFNLSSKNKSKIAKLSKTTQISSFNSQNCLVESSKNKLVGLAGVNNLAIIDTPDALLVCKLEDSYFIRNLISQIVASKKTSAYFLKSPNVKQ